MGAVVDLGGVAQCGSGVTRDKTGKGVGRCDRTDGGAVVSLADACVADGRGQGGSGNAGPRCRCNGWPGEAVVAGHAGGRAGSDAKARRTAGADAAGTHNVRRVVVQAQATGVERQSVTCNGTADAATHRRTRGYGGAGVGLGDRAADAGA